MINKVILVGNVGKDPEVRHLDNGVAVAQLSIATSETYKDKSGNKTTHTEWHNLVFWRGLAEVVEKYVKKGDPLYVEGKIRNRSYDDKDGIKRYITEIVVDSLQMLGRKPQPDVSSTPASAENIPASTTNDVPLETDDLPF